MSEEPKTILESHRMWVSNQSVNILDYLKAHVHRNYCGFTTESQLEMMSAIAKVELKSSRDLLLRLYSEATYMSGLVKKLHDELDLTYVVLQKINELLQQQKREETNEPV